MIRCGHRSYYCKRNAEIAYAMRKRLGQDPAPPRKCETCGGWTLQPLRSQP